jgi:hypothetical protein
MSRLPEAGTFPEMNALELVEIKNRIALEEIRSSM